MITHCRKRAEGMHFIEGTACPRRPGGLDSAQPEEGYDALVVALIIPDAAKRGMVNDGMKHTVNLHEEHVALLFIELFAMHTHADCVAALKDVIAGNPIRDLAGRDVTFDVDPATRR